MIIKVKAGQTIYDIALNKYGCYEGVFLLLQDNGLNLISDVLPGQSLVIRDAVPQLNSTNIPVVADMKLNSTTPNSGYKVVRNADFKKGDFSVYNFKVAI